jgi:hypothetical protein
MNESNELPLLRRETSIRLPVLAALAVTAVAQFTFWCGYQWAPVGTVFDGFLGLVHDQNMYFSYIRQGAEGDWLFVNRLTHIPHKPALLNIEWLAVGRLMALLGGTDRAAMAAYAVWHICGGLLIVGAFWWLAQLVLENRFQQRLALWLCVFGGGFGWVFVMLSQLGAIEPLPAAEHDISGSVHPFGHIFNNPHLSCSHGFSLLYLAAFVRAEQTGRPRWYVITSLIAAFHGLFRPYDLILISGTIPMFIVFEFAITREWSWRKTALRAMPLAVIAPVVAYYAALFQLHPVFKHWASQGIIEPLNFFWHYFSLGWAGLLLLLRLLLVRWYPLKSSAERMLLAWLAGVLFLFHGHRIPLFGFMPYTPVFGATLPTVAIVLGIGLFNPRWFWNPNPRWISVALLATFVVVSCGGSVVWTAKVLRNFRRLPEHYIPLAQYEAYGWLREHAAQDDVIFSTLFSGNRMAKFVSARFALGHLSVTPNVFALRDRVDAFYAGKLTPAEGVALLNELHPRWIWLSPVERELGAVHLEEIPGVTLRYERPGIAIYSYDAPNKTPAVDDSSN